MSIGDWQVPLHRGTPTEWERCYRPNSRCAHLRIDSHAWPVCSYDGRYDHIDPASWLGTGSQAEYDTAAALPLCKICAAATRTEVG